MTSTTMENSSTPLDNQPTSNPEPASLASASVQPTDSPPANDASELPHDDPIPDTRLYVPDNEDWDVEIKRDSERVYCYSKHPGQDWFHLILSGEIYLTRQHERYCLRCALRMGFLTEDRLFWQHRVPKRSKKSI